MRIFRIYANLGVSIQCLFMRYPKMHIKIGVCDIYIVCGNIVIVVLTMCNLTISSILQKPNSYVTECTHALACAVMKGLNSARD